MRKGLLLPSLFGTVAGLLNRRGIATESMVDTVISFFLMRKRSASSFLALGKLLTALCRGLHRLTAIMFRFLASRLTANRRNSDGQRKKALSGLSREQSRMDPDSLAVYHFLFFFSNSIG